MIEQFWWLYDLIAVVAVILCIYLSARKGIFKSAITLIGCIIGILISVPMSSAVSESIYKTVVRDNNVKTLDKSLGEVEISIYLASALEKLDYNVIVNSAKLDEILESEKDTDEQIYKYLNNINGKKVDNEENFRDNLNIAYAEVIKNIFSKDIGSYALETASYKIRSGKKDAGNLIKMMKNGENRKKVAEIIADDYINDAYITVIRLVAYTAFFAIIFIIGILTANSLSGSQRDVDVGTGSRVAGGICGAVTGVAVVFIIAVLVRLYVVMGSDETLFFDTKTIDKMYIFRYAYDIAYKL
ncbi:MAG: hypothetical protein K2K66_00100 [Ruminococcus sp.]|nr:hypothetical protein [Ruminococcus sp.]